MIAPTALMLLLSPGVFADVPVGAASPEPERTPVVCGDGSVGEYAVKLSNELVELDRTVGIPSLRAMRGLAEGSLDELRNLELFVLPELIKDVRESRVHLGGRFASDLDVFLTALGRLKLQVTDLRMGLTSTRQCFDRLSRIPKARKGIVCVEKKKGTVTCVDRTPAKDDYKNQSDDCHGQAEKHFKSHRELASTVYTVYDSHRKKKMEFDARLAAQANVTCAKKQMCEQFDSMGNCARWVWVDDAKCYAAIDWAKDGMDGLAQQDKGLSGAMTQIQTPLWTRLDAPRQREALTLPAVFSRRVDELLKHLSRRLSLTVAYPDIYDLLKTHLLSGLDGLQQARLDCEGASAPCPNGHGWSRLKDHPELEKAPDVQSGSRHLHAALADFHNALNDLDEIKRQEKLCALGKLTLSARKDLQVSQAAR